MVQAKIDEHRLNGAGLVVVQRDHGVVYEHYWGEFSADRISLVASASKMVTAGVLMHLNDAGLIDVDKPVAAYVPWGSANPAITTAQLISNTSGLIGLFGDGLPDAYRCQYIPQGTMQDCAASIFSTPDDDPSVAAPDTVFRYGGAQWQVAGAVAEAVSGKPWATLIEQIYTVPCALPTLAYNSPFAQLKGNGTSYPSGFDGDPSVLQPTNNPNMEGGAYATTADYAKLLMMYLNGGKCGDTQVLSERSIERMTSARIVTKPDGTTGPVGSEYGMGWWINADTQRVVDPGMYGAVPWLSLANGYGGYLIVEDTAAVGMEIVGQVDGPIRAAIAAG
ncbi:MAG TPA: serine hydrolase domain-containing protein [Ilumatobacteraceae bacterium]|nr:serine hydrolase domain-containing protein [Ilumatobacteraceae bacterium]